MCVTLAAASMANGLQAGGSMQAMGSGLQAVQSFVAGETQRSVANSMADAARSTATMQARAIRRSAEQQTGAARAAAAASGVKVGSGSVLDAERDIARYSEQDALSVLLSGQSEAARLRARGEQAKLAGIAKATDSLVHGMDAWQRTRRRSSFRMDDPYRVPGYVGGQEGE